jgi:tetratricopeptide (TPR) repeat protein
VTSSEKLDELERVYDRGRYLDAFRLLEAMGGPLGQRDTRGRLLAGRVMLNLGAHRLARLLTIRAHRQAPRDPDAAYYFCSTLAEARGPLAGLRFLERFGVPAGASAEARALLLLRRASLLGILRDFDEARALCEQAAALWDHPWLHVERSFLELQADRVAAAQRAGERALALDPRYRPALQNMAHLLATRGARGEAEALLAARSPELQAPYLDLQLAQLRCELDRVQEARASLLRAVTLMPWPELDTVRSLSALAASIHFKLGDREGAARFGRMTGSPAHARLADRLERALPDRRVLLEVPYVRQDHRTCAPATLTSICRYHQRPADHIAIVEEICYDGTPAASERAWAEEHGFLARHFTVSWDAAVALLDRGLPFALLTVEPGSAHLQAVVGYDLARGSFLIRDPSVSSLVEFDAEQLFASQKFSGPQGLVLVPREQAARLAGVPLPDAELHDGLFRLQLALLAHQRGRAADELAALVARAPGHVVTIQAERGLAAYDNNQAALLVAFDKLLAVHPEAGSPLLAKLSCLEDLARPEERRRQLAEAAERPDADSIFGRLWAEELVRDARQAAMAELWLSLVARRRPQDAVTCALLADLHALRGELPEACRLQRLAACLDDVNEALAGRYFRLARAVGRTDEALRFLRARVERLGPRSALPWTTLHAALQVLERPREAREVLAEAQAARPQDGELALFAANVALRAGQLAEARALLAGARGRVKETAWIRAAAALDRADGDRPAALARWRAVLATEPLSLEVHSALAQLLSETSGGAAAVEHLRAVAVAHPHHAGVLRLLVEFTDDEGEQGLEVLRRLVALTPTNAWARRELALRLCRRQRTAEAIVELDQAAPLEPDAPATFGVRGFVLAAAGRREDAREAFRQALLRSADYVSAFEGLLEQAEDAADRMRALRWLQQELRRQVVFGDGLQSFRTAARGLLDDEEILAFLEEARRARPDLLGCWTAVVQHLLAAGRLPEARRIAEEASQLFPLVIEPLYVLALVEERRGDRKAHRAALERCLQIEPGHAGVTRALAEGLERDGEAAAARRLLEAAIARAPLDVASRGLLADLLARSQEVEAALVTVRRALELEPGYEWGWDRLVEWSVLHDVHDRALEVADAVSRARPNAAGGHLGRARLLMQRAGRVHEALQALDAALACEPRLVDAHDRRAVLLARLERFDEALAACQPAGFGETPPVPLRGRRAWVLAERGKLDEAIRQMEEVVADSPGYLFGLGQLGDWYLARRRLDDARRCFERALALSPQSPDAALGLFDACLAAGDLDAAEQALGRVEEEGSPFVLSRRVQLCCRRRLGREAIRHYERLSRLPQPGSWPLLEAGRALSRIGHRGRALRILAAAMASGDGLEVTGEVWAHLASERVALAVLPGLRGLLGGGATAVSAVATYIENLAEARRRAAFWLARIFCGRALRRPTRVWGAVGYALLALGWRRLTVRWMSDHAGREDARPWMLNNLVLALRLLGRTGEASAISRRALALPADHVSDMHRRWLALDAALAGRPEEARAQLERALAPAGELAALVEAYARALLVAEGGGAEARARARAQIEEAAATHRGQATAALGRRLRSAVDERLRALGG